MNSPITTPTTAIVIATLKPLKIAGNANGKRTNTKHRHSDAVNERHNFNAAGSAAANPTAAAMTTGKKLMKAAKATRDVLPNPSQITNRGASATFGTSWKNTRLG